MKRFLQIFFAILFLVIFFIFTWKQRFQVGNNINYVKIGNLELKVDIANTNETREKGLSGKKELKENEGMLFIFEQPSKNYFWMKDMNFPIDIIWLDENLKVIYIKKDATPESYPESFGTDQNSKYVLEVVSNFSDKNNIRIGDTLYLLP